MALPPKVRIREVGPREGFQSISKIVPTTDKIKLINALSETGVMDIEVVSMVRPDRVPQMKDADEVVKGLHFHNGVRYTALYLNPKGFERAERLSGIDNEGWLMIAASDAFLQSNNNLSISQMIDSVPEWIAAFGAAHKKVHGLMVSTAFGDFDELVNVKKLCSVINQVLSRVRDAGEKVFEITLADTVGIANPEMVRKAVNEVRESFAGISVSLHLHDTRGRGLANAYAGLLEGVEIFDASVGGMGGCPFTKGGAGNICTEDFADLCHSLGIETGLSVEKYCSAAKIAEEITGEKLAGKSYKISKHP